MYIYRIHVGALVSNLHPNSLSLSLFLRYPLNRAVKKRGKGMDGCRDARKTVIDSGNERWGRELPRFSKSHERQSLVNTQPFHNFSPLFFPAARKLARPSCVYIDRDRANIYIYMYESWNRKVISNGTENVSTRYTELCYNHVDHQKRKSTHTRARHSVHIRRGSPNCGRRFRLHFEETRGKRGLELVLNWKENGRNVRWSRSDAVNQSGK